MAGKPQRKVDLTDLRRAVAKSASYRGVARAIGVGAGHAWVKATILRHGIDVNHFDFGKRSMARVGKTFGSLKILRVYLGKEAPKRRIWCECLCVCGVKIQKRMDAVITGRVLSCGCFGRSRPAMNGKGNPAWKGAGELPSWHVYNSRKGADRRGLSFRVSKRFLWALFVKQGKRCALSGLPLNFGRISFPHETSASLDRIDSALGYTRKNVQWVHKATNKIKRDVEQVAFIQMCRAIADWTRSSGEHPSDIYDLPATIYDLPLQTRAP